MALLVGATIALVAALGLIAPPSDAARVPPKPGRQSQKCLGLEKGPASGPDPAQPVLARGAELIAQRRRRDVLVLGADA